MYASALGTIFIGIILIILLRFYWKRRSLYYWASKVPGPLAFPLVGAAYRFIGSPPTVFQNMMNMFLEYPDLGKLWFGTQLYYLISKPEYLEITLNHPNAINKPVLYKYMSSLGGNGLITSPGYIWKRHRKVISPSFNQKILNDFMETFTKNGEILLEKWSKINKNLEVDVYIHISNCTLDIICESIFGVEVNVQKNCLNYGIIIDKWMDIVFLRMFKVWYHYDWIFQLSNHSKEFEGCIQTINDLSKQIIRRRVIEHQEKARDAGDKEMTWTEEEHKRLPFLDHVLETSTFSDQEILDEVNTFLLAGTDTNTSSICFTLVILGIRKDIQEKLYNEVIDILGPDRQITLNDLSELKYTERVIKESLRMFPVAALSGRELVGDIPLENLILPKGSNLVFGYYHTHRNEKYWPNPLTFNPDRFLPEESSRRHLYSWLPFSGGPRNCIGGKFAIMLMKIIVSMVVRKYRISSGYKTVEEVGVKMGIVLRPKDGWKVFIEPR